MSDETRPPAGRHEPEPPPETRAWHDDEGDFETFEIEMGKPEGISRFVVPSPDPPPPDAPAIDVGLEARYEWGSVPADGHHAMRVLLTLTPSGPPLSALTGGPSAHLILALDVSASMNNPDKFPVLLDALTTLYDEMCAPGEADSLLSVILFARGAHTLYQAIPISSLSSDELLEAVGTSPMLFGNYSDAVGALSRATRMALESHRANRALPVRIVLLTDGKLQDAEGAHHKIARIAHMPIDVDAIAFGSDCDVVRLKTVVGGRRGGTVKHARADTLSDAFRNLARSGRRVAARLALLRFETAPGVVGGAAYRYRPARHSYGPAAFERGRVFESDVGTLACGRAYSFLFELRLPQTTEEETEIGEIILRVPSFGGPRETRMTLGIPRHVGHISLNIDPLVTEAYAVVQAIGGNDAAVMLRSLKVRRRIYVEERRDEYLLKVIDRAITALERDGNMDALTDQERAMLAAHTATVEGSITGPRSGPREYSFG